MLETGRKVETNNTNQRLSGKQRIALRVQVLRTPVTAKTQLSQITWPL